VAERLTLAEAARRAGTTPATLRRWADAGLIPGSDGGFSQAAAAHARVVARLRQRGHSLGAIAQASRSGRLAFGAVEDLFPPPADTSTLAQAAVQTGLEPELIERIHAAMGFSAATLDHLGAADLQLLRYAATVLAAGFPRDAFLQLARVYGQAMARVADAEVRLFRLHVHEPLMRDGVDGVEMAREMQQLAGELIPLSSPVMDHVHQRFLQHFIEQDVVGHMETDRDRAAPPGPGRIRVAIAFADLAGYAQMTEELGDEEAVTAVERFIERVEVTLPDDARVVKTIGDEVMVVGSDAAALADWAVGFQALHARRPLPRIGLHRGETLYRDGDYFGREVNQAARVAARAAGGEVLVTRAVVAQAGAHLEFELIGEVRLKGFAHPTELYLARMAGE